MLKASESTDAHNRIRWLYDSNVEELYRYVQSLVPPAVEAREIVQDTFVRAFESLHQLRDDGMARAWLFRIARNVTLETLRNYRAELTYLHHLPKVTSADGPNSLLQVHDAMKLLPLHFQHVLYLRIVRNFTLREIASVLRSTPVAVRILLFRARRALMVQMRGWSQPDYYPESPEGDMEP